MENKKFDKEKFDKDVEQIVNTLKGRNQKEINILLETVRNKIKYLPIG
ncbi:hypothetical protein [Chryseobacterium gambrini]|uniref:Uncharacterized protein n=1 Tax=Chryseobacterium gambrini TaxID=373672 RepID=A0ABN7CCA7_9FLAO|nr:hypothetical protein CRDW_12770 [Chryseobacterium gambrini]